MQGERAAGRLEVVGHDFGLFFCTRFANRHTLDFLSQQELRDERLQVAG